MPAIGVFQAEGANSGNRPLALLFAVGAIADDLSLVFARRPVEREQLLLHQQRAMPADDFRNWRLLLGEPISSAFAPGSDKAVNATPHPSLMGSAGQLSCAGSVRAGGDGAF
jgi:hypothetical protein